MSDQLVINISGPDRSKRTLGAAIGRALADHGVHVAFYRNDTLTSGDTTFEQAADAMRGDCLSRAEIYVEGGIGHAESVRRFHEHRDNRDALPPVGPLTSTEGLRRGDVVRVLAKLDGGPAEGSCVRVLSAGRGLLLPEGVDELSFGWDVHAFAFVGRPDAEGWIPWSGGGENPAPGARGGLRFRDRIGMSNGYVFDTWKGWKHVNQPSDIVAFRIIGLTDTPRQGDPVEPPFGCDAKTIEVKGYDLSRTPKDIMERAFAIIHDAGPDCRIKELAIMPNTGRLRVEAWPDGSDGPLHTYEETVGQMLAYYRSTWATDGRWTPNPADARVTLSPHSVQDGDRVRVVIEGVVGQVHEFALNTITRTKLEKFGDLATIELLERPEKPLAVGDKVRWDRSPGKIGEIRSIDTETDEAWVRWANANNDRDYSTVRLSDLTRA